MSLSAMLECEGGEGRRDGVGEQPGPVEPAGEPQQQCQPGRAELSHRRRSTAGSPSTRRPACCPPWPQGQPLSSSEATEPPASVLWHKLGGYPPWKRKHCALAASLLYTGSSPTKILPILWGIKHPQHFGPLLSGPKSISAFWYLTAVHRAKEHPRAWPQQPKHSSHSRASALRERTGITKDDRGNSLPVKHP